MATKRLALSLPTAVIEQLAGARAPTVVAQPVPGPTTTVGAALAGDTIPNMSATDAMSAKNAPEIFLILNDIRIPSLCG
jgi:hypothetical protein